MPRSFSVGLLFSSRSRWVAAEGRSPEAAMYTKVQHLLFCEDLRSLQENSGQAHLMGSSSSGVDPTSSWSLLSPSGLRKRKTSPGGLALFSSVPNPSLPAHLGSSAANRLPTLHQVLDETLDLLPDTLLHSCIAACGRSQVRFRKTQTRHTRKQSQFPWVCFPLP